MSKERELLRQSLIALEDAHLHCDKFQDEDARLSVINQIKELLVQPEQDEYLTEFDRELLKEATATLCKVEKALKSKDMCNENLRLMVGDALSNIFGMMSYKGSPPKREPLSEDEVCEILLKKEWRGFVDLVRIIEKAHGIGE